MSPSTENTPKEWNKKDNVAIQALVNAGMSLKNIASQLSIPTSTVGRISKKLQDDSELNFVDKSHSSVPRKGHRH